METRLCRCHGVWFHDGVEQGLSLPSLQRLSRQCYKRGKQASGVGGWGGIFVQVRAMPPSRRGTRMTLHPAYANIKVMTSIYVLSARRFRSGGISHPHRSAR